MLQISLPEALFLLALHEEKGKVHDRVAMAVHYGLSGALLAEMALLKMVRIDAKGKVIVLEASPCGDDLIDDAYEKIKENVKPLKVRHWIEEFSSSNFRKLQKRLTDRLVEKKIISFDGQKYLWVIPFEAYPQREASARYWLKHHLREIVLAGAWPDTRTIALLNLVRTCRMLPYVFTHDEQKAARRKIDQLVSDESLSEETQDAIQFIEAAAITAALIGSE